MACQCSLWCNLIYRHLFSTQIANSGAPIDPQRSAGSGSGGGIDTADSWLHRKETSTVMGIGGGGVWFNCRSNDLGDIGSNVKVRAAVSCYAPAYVGSDYIVTWTVDWLCMTRQDKPRQVRQPCRRWWWWWWWKQPTTWFWIPTRIGGGFQGNLVVYLMGNEWSFLSYRI